MNEIISLLSSTTTTAPVAEATKVVADSGSISVGKGLVAIGAGLAMLGGSSVGVGQGIAVGRACEAIGRNPEAEKIVKINMIVGLAISETSAIYGLIVSLILIFAYN